LGFQIATHSPFHCQPSNHASGIETGGFSHSMFAQSEALAIIERIDETFGAKPFS
jgi:hypothetical protein